MQWLDNIDKMSVFADACEYGSTCHKLYHAGMSRAARYIRECVKLTPPGTL